jgi:SpoVK/Ycf46/Vps4 family AAA+-type ATPase
MRAEGQGRGVTSADLAAARLSLAPNELGRLAHPVDRAVGPDAIVTSTSLAADLSALIARCRRRESIWDGLGPSLAASTTRGVRALFAGESGTGKTMAASYVATALAAPLYRCDLAAVMNKYIGESEKNLGGLLDHAEAADVVLLFDEADALFGRRSEGTETGERYANMLTNYLLTRLEAHNGIVILTTNSKARIEPAFWRRLDHVIDFPAPGYAERLALWKSHLGQRAPPEPVIEHLAAYCDLAGGNVRNAVLAAAALARPDRPLGLDDLLPALQREYAKLRRTLPAPLAVTLRAAE